MKQVTPLEGFEITLRKFEKSQKGANDYYELFIVYNHLILSLGKRKEYEEIEATIKKVLAERPDQDVGNEIPSSRGKVQLLADMETLASRGYNIRQALKIIKEFY